MLYENNCKLFILTTYLFVPGSLKVCLTLITSSLSKMTPNHIDYYTYGVSV